MAMKPFPVHVPMHWAVLPGEKPGTMMLRLRHKSLADVQTTGIQGGETVVLAFSEDMLRDLIRDLTGQTASEPRPKTLDS